MKITFFIQDFSGGGAQHMIINMANEFAKRGHDVDLLVVNPSGPHQAKVANNVNIVNLDKPRVLSALWSLSRYISRHKPDIFLSAMTHTNILSVIARLFSSSPRTRLILTERTFLSVHIRKTPRIMDKLSLIGVIFLYRFADKIIGISKGVAADIQRLAHLKDDQVDYIYNPVITPYLSEQLNKSSLSQKNESSEVLIVTSGRLSYEKDYVTLLSAFAQLRKTQAAKLLILGQGPLQKELEDHIEKLKIKEHVKFVGFVPNSLEYMKMADLFIITSLYEGFCNVIVEALFCGLSVVSTNCPSGPVEILENGKYGLLAPVGDVEAITCAMAQALQKPFNPEKQRERALCFTVEKICDQYEKCFNDLLKN